jgi:C4-dicarboxylate-specific signal transduction histidine kinase
MKDMRALALPAIAVAAATLLFWLAIHQLSGVWLGVALRPELRAALEQHRDDQLRLRSVDPQHSADYRNRFENAQRLIAHIEILRQAEERMVRRFETILVLVFAFGSAAAALLFLVRQRRAELAERRAFAERIAALQETSRRQAHEIKGPLTAARLELDRCVDLIRSAAPASDVAAAHASVAEELDRLAKFTRGFVSFGGLGKPVLRDESLRAMLDDFCTTFAGAWGAMTLSVHGRDRHASADRHMLRQVLVNLCSNSAAGGASAIAFTIDSGASPSIRVRDDGRGVPPALSDRIFDPYVTTRPAAEGLGLGLAISRKIMLDHGGDLKLVRGAGAGATFVILFGERWN